MVGNPPGGAPDLIARAIAQALTPRLGQSIIIDNRPGANGNISAEVVAKSAPDGYTLLYANDSLVVVNPHIYSTIGVNVMRDMVPVVTTISNQLVLAVNPQAVPVKDFPAFIEFARKPNASLFYASIGNGSHHHLAMEILKQRAGIDLTHVPYKGGGPASIAVIAGENAVMFGGTSVLNHIKNGKLKGLADVRHPAVVEHAGAANHRLVLPRLREPIFGTGFLRRAGRPRPSSTSCARRSTACFRHRRSRTAWSQAAPASRTSQRRTSLSP